MIDEDHHEIRDLCKEMGLKLTRILRGGFGYVTPRRVREAPHRQPRRLARMGAPRRLPWRHRQTVPARRAAVGFSIASDIARRSVAQWLDDVRADGELRATTRGLRGFFLADPEELSLIALLDEFAQFDAPDGPVPRKMYRIEGGNDRLATALAAAARPSRSPEHRIGRRFAPRQRCARHAEARPHSLADFLRLSRPRAAGDHTATRANHTRPAGATARRNRTVEVRTRHEDAHPVFRPVLAGPRTTEGVRFRAPVRRRLGRQRGAARPRRHSDPAGRGECERRVAGDHRARRRAGVRGRTRLARIEASGAARFPSDRLGARSAGARRLCVLRSGLRSVAPRLARSSLRPSLLRRRAHESPVAGLYEWRRRKRAARCRRDRRGPSDRHSGGQRRNR